MLQFTLKQTKTKSNWLNAYGINELKELIHNFI